MKKKLKITALILCLMMALASLSACEFLPKPIKFYNDGDAVTLPLIITTAQPLARLTPLSASLSTRPTTQRVPTTFLQAGLPMKT